MTPSGDDVYALDRRLVDLRDRLVAVEYPLADATVAGASRERDRLVRTIDEYLLPRLRDLEAPLLAVVGGPTGSGKSTLVNSLVGRVVSEAGVRRPTTRAALLVCNPDDAGTFSGDTVLASLGRTSEPGQDPAALCVLEDDDVAPGVALLDAPDVDSVVEASRDLAGRLLGTADVWLFVVSAARYADAVPWELLHRARDRGTSVVLVLDRVRHDVVDEVVADVALLLHREGPRRTGLVVVPEGLRDDGLLPDDSVALLRGWLAELSSDRDARAWLVYQTLMGMLDGLESAVTSVADAVDTQSEVWSALLRQAEQGYARAATSAREVLTDGTMLRGEVLARWRTWVELRRLARVKGTRRRPGRVARAFGGAPGEAVSTQDVQVSVTAALQAVVQAIADDAADAVAAGWRFYPAGSALLDASTAGLDRASPDTSEHAARAAAEWQAYAEDLVRDQGGGRRSARARRLDTHDLTLALVVTALAPDPQVGAHTTTPPPDAATARRLAVSGFGEDSVSSLVVALRADLVRRVQSLVLAGRARYTTVLDTARVDGGLSELLREAVKEVDRVR